MASPGWPAALAPESAQHASVFWWLVRLRWVAVAGVAGVLLLAGPVLDRLPEGVTPWLWATATALALYNAALTLLGPRERGSWLTSFAGQITVDCVALATLLHFAGGIENPFLPLFVLHVVNAGIVLSERAALGVLGLAIALVAVLALGEAGGLFAHHCLPNGPEAVCTGGALGVRALALLGGLVLTLVASSLFTSSLTARLRAGQERLVATVSELESETERLAQARAAGETARSRLQAIVDAMEDAVTFLGPDGGVLFTNQRARELWRAENPRARVEALASLGRALQGEPIGDGRSSFERAGRSFDATRSLVRGAQGEILGVVLVVRDVTTRLAMERHLMHDEQMVVVGKLAAAVAHEINNPIGVVFLYSQHALAALPPESPVKKHLETIRRNAESCRRIIGGLLNLARPQEPERHRVDLRLLCREVIDSVQPLAAAAGVRVSSGSQASEVPIWAQADGGMLRQALLNLAVNAVEASEPGGDVSVGAYETQDGEATASAIEVRDKGPGIAPEQLDRLFLPFFTTKPTGTGLGLAVAENVVKSHNGRIDVESTLGEGTLFRIVLPEPRSSGAPLEPPRSRPHHEALGRHA